MKKRLLISLLILVPILVSAIGFNNDVINFGNGLDNLQYLSKDRSWRLSERTELATEDYYYINRHWEFYYDDADFTRLDSVQAYIFTDPSIIIFLDGDVIYNYDNTSQHVNRYVENDFYFGSVIPNRVMNATFNAQNHLSTEMRYHCYEDSIGFVPEMRAYYSYNGDVLSEKCYWSPDVQINGFYYFKYILMTNEQGKISDEIEQTSNDSLNWVNFRKTTYTYHPHNTMGALQYTQWNDHNFAFMYDASHYAMAGMPTELLQYVWSDSVWVLTTRVEVTYNDNDEPIEILYQYLTDDWNTSSRIIYTYDSNGNVSTQQKEDWLSEVGMWNFPIYIDSYIWEQTTANSDEVIVQVPFSVSISPNPFRERANIAVSGKESADKQAKIYNLKGQLVKTIDLGRGKSAEWDGTNNAGLKTSEGIYIVKVNIGGKIVSRKVMKLR